MGLEDQVGEALQAPVVLEAPEVLEGGVQFLLEVLEALEALEDGVQFLLEGLGSRVALVLGALDLVASSGHGKLEPQLTDGKLTFAFLVRKLLSLLFSLHLLASEL
jgi:hypothetical protein